VFKAIVAADCTPRFVDIDAGTYCLSAPDLAAKSRELDAVIAAHIFGNMCDVPRLRDAAPGKPFIEDCAQALGSRLSGRVAGSFGDASVFSFRLGKYLSVGEGGAIYCGDTDLAPDLSRCAGALPAPGALEECVHVGATYARSLLRGRLLWGPVGTRVWKAYNQNVRYTSQSPLVVAAMHRTDVATTLRRLPRLDAWIQAQRSNADYYERNLTIDSAALCIEPSGAFYNRLQYPLLLRTPGDCEQLSARLRTLRVGTGRPYKDIAAVAAGHYGYAGDCPVAERVAQTVLVIPCNHGLRAADLTRVGTSVNKAWAEIHASRSSYHPHETGHSGLQDR
jgi:dTDP-4-amino-4,6-dideoxygalactose transaminase